MEMVIFVSYLPTMFPNIEKTGHSSLSFQELCLTKAGVAVISGTSFGKFGEGFVRFSYANSTQNIIKAIKRIKLQI